MRMKQAIKKIVALAAGTTMLGTTLMAAGAADLADYPSPFVKDGVFDGLIVVGEKAATEDVIGAVDIAASLQAEAYTATEVECEGGITVSGGETQEVPLGRNVTNDGTSSLMDTTLKDDDLSGLQDTSIDINGTEIDVHDEVRLNGGVDVVTSLSVSDDDYKSAVYLEVEKGALKYCYVFDETVNLDVQVDSSNPLKIDFLGDSIEITDIVDADTIKAIAGTKVFMDAGDTIDIEGKTVTFVKAGSSSVVVDVDGEQEVISSGSTETVNGVKIKVESIFNEDGTEFDSANLIVGADAEKNYDDGDGYIGEDESNPDWTWVLAGLNAAGSGTDNDICIQNEFAINDLSDDPPGVGEYISFPDDFIQVGIDSLTVADDSYGTYKVYYESSTDLSDSVFSSETGEKTFVIESVDYSEGITLLTADTSGSWNYTNITTSTNTDKVYLHVRDYSNGVIDVFYEDTDNKVRLAGNITLDGSASSNDINVLQVNYQDTKSTDIPIDIRGNLTGTDGTDNVTLVFDVDETTHHIGTDDIIIWLGNDNTGDFNSLGGTLSTDEDDELVWATTSIGTKNEDHRTQYGIIIKDPESNGNNDEVHLEIPGDVVKANVVVKTTGTSVASASGTSKEINPIPVGMGVLDKDVTVGDENLIVVGGPCANTVAADLLGNPDPCAEGFEQGKAMLKLFESGDKVSLLVAGYEAMETQGACRVLADYEDYDLSGDDMEVIVTSLTDLEVTAVE